MTVEQVVLAITPFLIFGVTELVKKFGPALPGWVIVSVIVPLLSAAAAWIATLITPESSWLIQLAVGLLAVFVREMYKQLTQIGKPAQ